PPNSPHRSLARRWCCFFFSRRETGRDMLWPIPIERLPPNHAYPLDDCLVSRIADALDPRSCWLTLEDLRPPQHLQTGLPGVVNQHQRHPIVRHQIAGADELLIARKIGEGDRAFVDDFQKARRAAPVLNIGPTGLADTR